MDSNDLLNHPKMVQPKSKESISQSLTPLQCMLLFCLSSRTGDEALLNTFPVYEEEENMIRL